MKNGKFINFFWWKMEKTCSIMVSKVKSHNMAGRGDFSNTWLLLYQGILIFFVFGLYADGKCSFFWMPQFWNSILLSVKFEKINATKMLFKKSLSTVSPEIILEKKWRLKMEISTPLRLKCQIWKNNATKFLQVNTLK